MAQFFKNILSSFLGSLIALVLGGIITIFIIIGFTMAFDDNSLDIEQVEKSNFIKFSFSEKIVEFEEPSPLKKFKYTRNYFPSNTSLFSIISALNNIAEDADIKGVYLNLTGYQAGLAQTQEIESALLKLKAKGKTIVAYSNSYNEKTYQLASNADYIGITPLGKVEYNGIAAETMYYTGLFEKLDIGVQIFKCGKYKSAVEPFFRKDMSEANRNQLSSFLGDIQDGINDSISSRRKIEINNVKSISDNLIIRSAQDALHYNFITHVDYEKNYLRSVKNELELDDIKLSDYSTYLSACREEKDFEQEKFAIVFAEGSIIDGSSQKPDYIGQNTVINELERLTEDSTVKGIILRINSPGGSALASDIMWAQIQETRNYKPVVASMSDYAASGGYYMAMGCDYIVAQPQTITGSIGVFGMFPFFGDFYKNKLGITYDTVTTGKYANIFSTTKPLSVEEKEVIQTAVDHIYETFLSKASEGREMDIAEVEDLASGRVWTGNQASLNGLIDELGGISEAKVFLNQKIGKDLPLFTSNEIEEAGFESEFLNNEPETIKLETELSQNPIYKIIKELDKIEYLSGIQTRLPYRLEVK